MNYCEIYLPFFKDDCFSLDLANPWLLGKTQAEVFEQRACEMEFIAKKLRGVSEIVGSHEDVQVHIHNDCMSVTGPKSVIEALIEIGFKTYG